MKFLALVGAPLLFLLLSEGILRLAGVGYPTRFFLPSQAGGHKTFRENPRFGWRFFPRAIARSPLTMEIPRDKGDAFRIVVVGESAALGDPDDSVSFGRILKTLMEARNPGRRVEVIPAAMTAINSHVLREVVRDCRPLKPDLFVIYMGNNEVVGPFGAGTVFGRAAPLGLIRAQIFLKRFRLVQLLDQAKEALNARRHGKQEWKGMEMFLDRQVALGAPGLEGVYRNFQSNLGDILDDVRGMGAEAVVCTVAVNLKDGGPFASNHRPGLSKSDETSWEKFYGDGRKNLAAGDAAGALPLFEKAASLDDVHADLAYQRALALSKLGRWRESLPFYQRARDLDTLRFRADTRINDILRRTAADRGLPLADIDKAFMESSAGGVPGHEFLLEHVHMTFAGNDLTARRILDALAPRLPPPMKPLPDEEEAARLLAHNAWTEERTYLEVQGRLGRPPFTNQSDHDELLSFVQRRLKDLSERLKAGDLKTIRAAMETRARELPDDGPIQVKLSELARSMGDMDGEISHRRRLTEIFPDRPWLLSDLGFALAQAHRGEEAEAVYRRLKDLARSLPDADNDIGVMLEAMGRPAEALPYFRRALKRKPDDANFRMNLGATLIALGETEEGVAEYRGAAESDPSSSKAHFTLAVGLERLGKPEQAEPEYRRAIDLDPSSVKARHNLGVLLSKEERDKEAMEQLTEVLRINPDVAASRADLGLLYQKSGDIDTALVQYRKAIALDPHLPRVHYYMGLCLQKKGCWAEAAERYGQEAALDPEDVETRYNQANALQRLGRLKEAEEAFRGLLGKHPDHWEAAHRLAWLLATSLDPALRDGPAAVKLAEGAAQATNFGNPLVLNSLAAAYAETGRYEEARQTSRAGAVLAFRQGNAGLARQIDGLGEAYYAAGKPYRSPQ